MTKKILILPGDGIGQEVTASAKEVLDFLIAEHNLDFSIEEMDAGGTAYDKFRSPLPENVCGIGFCHCVTPVAAL